MNKYVVLQPIKDKKNNIFAYEMMYEVEKMDIYNYAEDFQAADAISDFFMQNNHIISDDTLTFITFTPNLLFKNVPRIFESGDLVIQIDESVIIHPLYNNLISKYRKEGYKIALNNFRFTPQYFAIIDSIDYIKIDFKRENQASIENLICMAKGLSKKCIATGVETKNEYEYAMATEVNYLQGAYIAQKTKMQTTTSEFKQDNFFKLIVEVTKDDADFDKVEEIMSLDARLTYSILKIVNSPYFALRHRVTTIHQALMLLGLVQLKRWVYLLSFKEDNDFQSDEILKTSFMRASFCSELIKFAKDMPINKNEAYLMGMFSTLDLLIGAPLSKLLGAIYVADEIKDALLNFEGSCGALYKLVLSYEKADWNTMKNCAEELEVPTSIIAQIYYDCIKEVNTTWDSMFSYTDD
ncbi:Cyclic di-GMP phosphodiesterase CdgJ [bioreactor metagenome]|uniref:Cyclic di-GMP phosphodiesterase CdgJ n=1 Tax=bioreactor metagenome TaxID=1076179 RepID=A0A645A1E4_9ZZZZ